MELAFYNWYILDTEQFKNLPGIENFGYFYKAYTFKSLFNDRTETIIPPINTKTLFPLPSFRPINKTYEDVCNDRAVELLDRAERLGVRLIVSWSGGIDSTLVLVSLLKNATLSQKDSITVLLSEDSINENPQFYREYIHYKIPVISSELFIQKIGDRDIFVSGELNDQLFGSDMVSSLISYSGPEVINQTYNRSLMHGFFNSLFNNAEVTDHYINLFERIASAAPIPIVTNFEVLWWLNFAVKWQSVYMRALSMIEPSQAINITQDYLNERYAPFYCTEDFQLWSMNNMDKKIKDTWKSYKWLCKDIIYDYTKDADYRDNKIKKGSLCRIVHQMRHFNFIDSDFHFYTSFSPEFCYNPNNDFV